MARTPEYFVGKTIIITGAASGIDAATALIFAREGANIVLADINKDKADEVAAAVKKLAAGVLAVALDVSDRADVDKMVKAAVAKFGMGDFPFNSAGAAGRRPSLLEIDQALWEQTFALNSSGVFQLHATNATANVQL
jgi:3-oxoacyl-[acyl-carrier protein] reductase